MIFLFALFLRGKKIYVLEVVGKDRELRREGVIGLLDQLFFVGG